MSIPVRQPTAVIDTFAGRASWQQLAISCCILFLTLLRSAEAIEARVFQDDVGNLHIEASASGDVHIDPGFNGSVWIGKVNVGEQLNRVGELARRLERLEARTFSFRPQLWAMGGWSFNVNGATGEVTVFDGRHWSRATSLQTAPKCCFGTVVYNNLVYIIGGQTTTAVATVEMFDGSRWGLSHTLSSPRSHLDASVFRGKIYAVGGQDGAGTPLATVESYDDSMWLNETPLHTARWMHGVATLKDKLYAIGGFGLGRVVLKDVEVYDGSSWTSAPAMPTARRYFGSAVFNDLVFVVGGITSSDTDIDVVEMFDGSSWTAGPPITRARRALTLAVLSNTLYAIGGFSDRQGGPLDLGLVEAFNGTAWSEAPSLPNGRHAIGCVAFPLEDSPAV